LYNNEGGDKLQSYFDTINLIRFAKDKDNQENGTVEAETKKTETQSNATQETTKADMLLLLCQDCKVQLEDPKPEEEMIFLHAFSYKKEPEWNFRTTLPSWCQLVPGHEVEVDIPLADLTAEDKDLDLYFQNEAL
jgi:hypothetical protein